MRSDARLHLLTPGAALPSKKCTVMEFSDIHMEDNYTIQYEPPVSEVVELKAEGIVCASGKYNGFGEEETW